MAVIFILLSLSLVLNKQKKKKMAATNYPENIGILAMEMYFPQRVSPYSIDYFLHLTMTKLVC